MPAAEGYFRLVFLAPPSELEEVFGLMKTFTERFRA
jgi:aspartate/methionine/tyrosine aminotransferase